MPDIKVFNRFDAAAIAEAERPAPANFTESIRRLSALIDLLPQRPVIEDKHAERWVNRCIEMAITRMELEHGEGKATIASVHEHVLWHVRRASAIGGSEIGTVVRHFRGEKGGFSNARNLTLEKLLIMAPQAGDEAMNRGVRAEPWLQRMYLEEHDCVSDEGALDVLKGFRWEKAPQIVGTPDDLILYKNGRRRIIDYKCPSAAVNEEYEKKGMVSFDYVCQVHQYGIFSRESGIEFDGMDIECFDPRYFKLVTYEIVYDPALEEEMIAGADTLWNEFVMKGVVPDVPGLGTLDTEDEETKSLMENLTLQASVLKVIGDEVMVRQKEILSRVQTIGNNSHALNEGKIDLGFAAFDRKRSWDEEILGQLATAAGLEIEDFMQGNGKFDAEAGEALLSSILEAYGEGADAVPALLNDIVDAGGVPQKKAMNVEGLLEALEEIGVDVSPAAGISEKFSLSRAKKNAEKVMQIKNEAIRLSDTIEEVVEQGAADLLRDPAEVAEDELMMEP